MPYDIYGQPLERGFCEVHPHVRQEYPCELCRAEHDRHEREHREHYKSMAEQERAYYARQYAEIEIRSWCPNAPWFTQD